METGVELCWAIEDGHFITEAPAARKHMGILAKLHKRAGIVLQHDEIHTLKIVHEWWSHLCPPNMPNGAEWKCWGTIKMRNGQSPVPRAKMISANLVQGFRIYPWIAVPSFPQIPLCCFSFAIRPQPLRVFATKMMGLSYLFIYVYIFIYVLFFYTYIYNYISLYIYILFYWASV